LGCYGREAAQKQLMAKVRDYLQEMEVDQFFIDKMMWTSSQDAYVTTLADVLGHHLNEIVPSVEEIILRSCDVLTHRERDLFDKTTDRKIRDQLLKKLEAASTCKANQLDILRSNAWDREHENELQLKCGRLNLQEQQSLAAFFKKPPDPRSAAEKQLITLLFEKQRGLEECRARLLLDISMAALTRYRDASHEAEEKQTEAPR